MLAGAIVRRVDKERFEFDAPALGTRKAVP
jgi:hypothetical protein